MKKIGFIGLGVMGKHMAINILKAGYSVTVFDFVNDLVDEVVKKGAKKGVSSKDVASKSDIIITMLQNSPNVKQAILGKDGVMEGAKSGSIVIDMSSIAPLVSKEVSKELLKKGIYMLDAPVSGGEPKAVNGSLAIMVGGPESAFNEVKDLLSIMGASVNLVGDIGSGNTTKLANQIMVAANIAGMSEAMVLATKAGVDPKKVFEAIRVGLAGSTVLDAKMPLILARKFDPGFRIELHIKDLNNVMETANSIGVPLSITPKALEIFENLKEAGNAKDDHCGMIKYYEKLANVEVKEGN